MQVPVETLRLKNFILGFMLPFVVFMLSAAPVASRPVPLKTCSISLDAQKLQDAQVESGEKSEEDSSEDALAGTENKIHQTTCILDIAFVLTHPDFTAHRILDHAHDGRGPPSIS